MENSTTDKRVRDELDEPEVNSPELKRSRVESANSEINTVALSDGVPEEVGESAVNLPTLKQTIHGDIFGILDDSDTVSVTDDLPEIQGLESLIRGFEEEIKDQPVVNLNTSFSGEWQPEIGFLLEASDDELGIPPSVSTSGGSDVHRQHDVKKLSSDSVVYGDILNFDDDVYGFAAGDESVNGDFVALGGLFHHESNGFDDFSYQI